VELFVQQLVNGVNIGAIYALIALGFATVFSVLRMIHFAHGDTYMFAVFITLAVLEADVPVPVALPAGLAAGVALALLVERVAYRPLRQAHPMMPILTAIVTALVLRELVRLIFGPRTLSFPRVFPEPFEVAGIVISGTQILTLLTVGVTLAGFTLFIRRTKWGRALLLMRQDLEAASLMGIPVHAAVPVVYGVAGLLGVVGGLLLATSFGAIDPQMGLEGTVVAFVAAIVGGLGGLGGAVVGGLTLGLVETMSAAYLSSAYEPLITFGVLILVLLVRPEGLMPGQARLERV
jgi:branched-chain amino acid transport system permease protein